ncbi:MAG: hypoxanthine-guanine phosphoribosyltransferase [Gammaproteobacteria bacterium]|nr:hypoxanthine-guanine phosphoribosyltransferase [Gammaproteobacteria bacterium]
MERVLAEAECLADEARVLAAIDAMGHVIAQDLRELNPLVLTVMTGALIPAGLLLARLHFPLQMDYVHASRYGGATIGSELRWLAKPRTPLAGRHVLLIDDILDTGLTLAAIIAWCREQGAASVRTAVLCEKPDARQPGGLAKADYVGLTIPNRYVFGYGLDYQEYWRNAPGIYAVKGL